MEESCSDSNHSVQTAGTTAAAVVSVGHEVVKSVADVMSTAASATVSHMAHANAMEMSAAESVLPTSEVMIVLNSEIEDAAGAGAAASLLLGVKPARQ